MRNTSACNPQKLEEGPDLLKFLEFLLLSSRLGTLSLQLHSLLPLQKTPKRGQHDALCYLAQSVGSVCTHAHAQIN